MRSSIVPGALSALALVAAQAQNFTIDPNSVPVGTRSSWCQAQINNCMTLCGGSFAVTPTDTCDYNTLDYDCKCSNGSAPGLQYYTGTMPYFICTEAWSQCNTANENNAQGQESCKENIKDHCGTLNPVAPSSSSSSSSSGSSPTGSAANGSQTGSASAPSATGTSPAVHGAAAANHALLLGNGAAIVVAACLAALL